MRIKFISLAIALACASSVALAEDFRLHGAATLGKNIVIPNQAAIEAKAGTKLSVQLNGSGNGLLDLAGGKADMAMIAAPLEVEAKIINEKTPGALDAAALKVVPVSTSKINFIVNPGNPVKKLTADQVKGIFTGKIANWKEVGGADSPILVIAEVPGQGTRANVEYGFVKAAPAASVRTVPTLAQVAQIVGQAPNAFGYGNSSSITPAVAVVEGVEVDQPLSLVTKGAPSAAAQKVIDAVVATAKK